MQTFLILTFRRVKRIFRIRIDLNQQRILFNEHRVHVGQQLHNLILHVAQTQLVCNHLALLRLETANHVNRFVDYSVRILCGHILNINATLR